MRLVRVLLTAGMVLVGGWAVAAVAAETVTQGAKTRGEMIDIGGRKLRLVCEGPRSERPVVWLESGAFSGAADWAAVQQKLTALHLRSCAYDRAGMGWSDPGPEPRDGDAITADLEQLVSASGERGPFILAGHSMAGLYIRQFALRHPDQVVGLVFVDAVSPEMLDAPEARGFEGRMRRWAQFGAVAGSLGLTKPLYLMGDRIGLPPQGRAEKRRGFTSGRQSRAAYAEVKSWRAAGRQAAAGGALDPAWPVAVVTAGQTSPQRTVWDNVRASSARASRAGFVDNVDEADHRTVLGLKYGDRVVAGILHVLKAVGR